MGVPVESLVCSVIKNIHNKVNGIAPKLWGSARFLKYQKSPVLDILDLLLRRVLTLIERDGVFILDD